MFMWCYRSGQGEEGQVRSLLRSRSKSSSRTPAGAPAVAVAGSSAGGTSSAAIESVPADPTMCRHPYCAAECEQLASEDDCTCSDSYTVAVSRSQPVSTFVFPAVLHVSVQSPHVGSAAHASDEFVTPPDHDPQQLKDWKQASDELDFRRWPSSSEVLEELKQMNRIAGMMVIMGLLLYARAMISMLFLGHLGELELAGGSLSIGFANITGYSVLSGLAMGMEPICGQAYGAKRWHLMGLALQRMLMVLLCACVPITFLWLNMQRILLWCGQEEGITVMAHLYILFSIPDLLAQVVLNPLRIYLRTQNIVVPLVWCAALALLFHVAINFLLVHALEMGVRGVALAASWTDFNLVGFLLTYLWWSGRYKNSWTGWSRDCLKEWRPLLNLAIPSCVSVCLEWWWYEFMIILSGLLIDPDATVASMGILIQTTALLYIFPSALSLAVSTRVGNELGANRPNKARIAMLVALGCAGVVAVVAAILTTTMRHTWGWIFTSNKEILSLTAIAMPIVGLCELGNCPQTTGCGVLRGSARPSVGANINLGSFYFVGMPVAMILGFLFNVGFVGLWFGLLAAQYTCATLMLCVLFRTDWPLQAARAQLLLLSSSTRDGDQAASAVAMTNHELIIRCDQTNHQQLICCDQTNYQLICCCDQTNQHQLICCLPNELQLEQLVEVQQQQQQQQEDQELVLILDSTASEEMKAGEYRTKKLLQDQRLKITVDYTEETESLISIN